MEEKLKSDCCSGSEKHCGNLLKETETHKSCGETTCECSGKGRAAHTVCHKHKKGFVSLGHHFNS